MRWRALRRLRSLAVISFDVEESVSVSVSVVEFECVGEVELRGGDLDVDLYLELGVLCSAVGDNRRWESGRGESKLKSVSSGAWPHTISSSS
jgi:hypothetical protein